MAISYVFNPFTGTMAPVSIDTANVGGLYGVNVETLTGHKTLVPNVDKIYQYLTPPVNRNITLDTASATAGDRFVIKHNADDASTKHMWIWQGGWPMDQLWSGAFKAYIFDGSNWQGLLTGASQQTPDNYNNIQIGYTAKAYGGGVAIGRAAVANGNGVAIGLSSNGSNNGFALGGTSEGYNHGVAIGYASDGYAYGVAFGYKASGITKGVGIGYRSTGNVDGVAIGNRANTDGKQSSIALGYESKCIREAELSININATIYDPLVQENNMIMVGFAGTTANATPAEIFCAENANSRCTVRASSALTFKIMVTARDNTAGDCAAYIFDGLIKRDAANNTTMSVCNKTVTHEDDASWDCNVTADDTNEALIITVTGDAANDVQWAARLDGVETHF